MLFGLLFLLLVVLILLFTEEYLGKYKWTAYALIALALIVYAGIRPVGFDRDSENYESIFMHPDSNVSVISVEPSFLFLSKFLYIIYPDIHLLFFFYALLGVAIKFYAIRQITPLLFLPVIIYMGNFFLLHDLTQIRVGVASAFFLLSVDPLSKGRKKLACVYIIMAIIFHYSALALIPLLFLNNASISQKSKIIWALIVPLCFILYAIGTDVLTTFEIPYITEKVETYRTISENKLEKESILNPFPLIKMAVFLYFLYYSDLIKQFVPSIYLLIKILGASLLAYFMFSSIKIISMRISELYGIIEIVAYPCILYTVKPIVISKCIVCIIAFIGLYFQLIQWGILDFAV